MRSKSSEKVDSTNSKASTLNPMTVSITLGELANAVRRSPTVALADVPAEYVAILTDYLSAATSMVERRAPLAPTDSQNRAVAQIVGYWFESPLAPAQRFGYNAWQHSGAAQILGPFIERRAQAI